MLMSDVLPLGRINVLRETLLPIVNGYNFDRNENVELSSADLNFLGKHVDIKKDLDQSLMCLPCFSGVPGKWWPLKLIQHVLWDHNLLTDYVQDMLQWKVTQRQQALSSEDEVVEPTDNEASDVEQDDGRAVRAFCHEDHLNRDDYSNRDDDSN